MKPLPAWLPPVSLLVLAAAARSHRLTTQLWHDEISALHSIRRPALEIATSWPGASSHVLYELLAHAGLVVFGEGPLGIRLPAAVFGVAAVVVFYLMLRPLLGRGPAWFLAGLLAVSYHHVFFSQNARGYTQLIFFGLASTHLLLLVARRERASPGLLLGYAVTGALAAYTNLLGMFVVAGHVAVVLPWRLTAARRPDAPPFPLRGFLLAVAGAAALSAFLYAPLVQPALAYVRTNVATPAEGPRLGFWLVVEVVEGLAAGFGGAPGLLAGVGLAASGAWYGLRRAPLALCLLAAPPLLQAAALVAMGAGIHPRYLALALPVVYLLGGLGLLQALEIALARLPAGRGREPALAAALCLLVLASALPLRRYYSMPKQDYLGALAALDALGRPGDRKVGVSIAGNALNGYYHAGYDQVGGLDELLALEADGSRIWLVTTLERLLAVGSPELHEHIQEHYHMVRLLPGSVGDGAVRIYVRDS